MSDDSGNRIDEPAGGLSRLSFVALSVTVGLGVVTQASSRKQREVVATDVNVKTPDGTCDAVFIHPSKG